MPATGTRTVARPLVMAAVWAAVSRANPAPGSTHRSQFRRIEPIDLPVGETS